MRKTLFDTPIDWLSPEAVMRKIATFVVSGSPHQITTVNPEFIVLAQNNQDFKQTLLAADMSLPDGAGVGLAQRFFDICDSPFWPYRCLVWIGTGLQFLLSPVSFPYQRITGVELTDAIMAEAAKQDWKIFLLGGKKGIAEKAGETWQQENPGLTIAGMSHANPDNTEIVKKIRDVEPDILLVAYGAPKQDLFIFKHKSDLKVPVMIGVGGTFDTKAGTKYNPPTWLKAIGLEWLGYLIRYPKRLGRIWRSTVTFSSMVIQSSNK